MDESAGAWGPGPADGRPGSAGEHLLQERYGTRTRADRFYRDQVLDHLNETMIEFVSRMEMMFVATADGHGECDCTFRAGPPGFVRVLDERRVAWPEYRGNGVMASLGNMFENAHAGLMFVDFFRDVIGLHINGVTRVVPAEEMLKAHPDLPTDTVPGRRPERWVEVTVEEAYIHCAKHIPRLEKVSRERAWGTDDARRKGGDFFGVAAARKRAAAASEPTGSGATADGTAAASTPAAEGAAPNGIAAASTPAIEGARPTGVASAPTPATEGARPTGVASAPTPATVPVIPTPRRSAETAAEAVAAASVPALHREPTASASARVPPAGASSTRQPVIAGLIRLGSRRLGRRPRR